METLLNLFSSPKSAQVMRMGYPGVEKMEINMRKTHGNISQGTCGYRWEDTSKCI
jgi:hypothetical protein